MGIKKRIVYTIFVVFFFLFVSVKNSRAEIYLFQNKELIDLYTPILYFHQEEIFRPQTVEVLVNESRLRLNRNNWFDVNIKNKVSISDLMDTQGEDYFLDVWYGTAGESDYKNYSAHRAYYLENLSPDAGGPPVSAYARVVEDRSNQKIIIQYWLFYYYNDWFNKHEGDWELVQVVLDDSYTPEWVILSQHHGGTRRSWDSTQVEDGTHPKVFVALGSHANYFWGDEIYPNGIDIGKTRVEILDRTGTSGGVKPKIIIMPDENKTWTETDNATWLNFKGSWGEQAFQSNFGGPTGPIQKGEQWEDPYRWGNSQPLDIDVWYKNRLKLRIEDVRDISFDLLTQQNLPQSAIDVGNGFFIFHSDLIDDINWTFSLRSELALLPSIHSYLPVPDLGLVHHYRFIEQSLGIDQIATIIIKENGQPFMQIGDQQEIDAELVERFKPAWESPDLVWFVGYMSANQLVTGVVVSLAAGILPALFYILLVNNFDKREKEPKSLVAAVFFWGAIPAVLVALFVRIYFQTPPDLMGPNALEAVRTGLFSPLIEEVMKGIIVLFVALRFRKEFNNLLDGIIYGSMVGLGFAMTGNVINFLGTFFFRGLSSLQPTLFGDGLLSSLNHAFYTSIFGAGLGLSLSKRGKLLRASVPATAFLLAVLVNGIHGYFSESLIGITPLVFMIRWLGVGLFLGILVLATRHEEKLMQDCLKGVIDDDFYQIVISRKRSTAHLKAVRSKFGRDRYKSLEAQFQLAAKLASMIYQAKFKHDPNLLEEIEKLKKALSEVKIQTVA